jgi:hypothetical protein
LIICVIPVGSLWLTILATPWQVWQNNGKRRF